MNENEQINPDRDFTKGVSVPEADHKPFPFRPEVKEPRIFIEQEVYDAMQAHAAESHNVELCGVLVGKMYADESGNFLHIVGSIRGEYARNQGTNVSFTPETWDYINEQREQKYPDFKVIGWYHTHPGFKVFFSGMDKFIQDYFFNDPYYIAVVIDPKIDSTGCFAWIDGKLKGLSRWWVGDKEVELTVGPVGNDLTEQDINAAQDTDPEEIISEDFIQIAKEFVAKGKQAYFSIQDVLLANGGAAIIAGITMFIFGCLLTSYFNSKRIENAYASSFRAENREFVTNFIADSRSYEELVGLADSIGNLERNLQLNLVNQKLTKEEKDNGYQVSERDLSRITKEDLEKPAFNHIQLFDLLNNIKKNAILMANKSKNRREQITEFFNKQQTYPERVSVEYDNLKYMREILSENIRQQVMPYLDMMVKGKLFDENKHESIMKIYDYIKSLRLKPDRDFDMKYYEYIQEYEAFKIEKQKAAEAPTPDIGKILDNKEGTENSSEQPQAEQKAQPEQTEQKSESEQPQAQQPEQQTQPEQQAPSENKN